MSSSIHTSFGLRFICHAWMFAVKFYMQIIKKKSYSYFKYCSTLTNNFYPFFFFILTLLVLLTFPSLICILRLTAYLSSYVYIDNSIENLIFNKRLSLFNKVHLVQIGFILPRPLLQLFLSSPHPPISNDSLKWKLHNYYLLYLNQNSINTGWS